MLKKDMATGFHQLCGGGRRSHTLEHAEEIGLGSRKYEIVEI